ncbi:MAG: polyprenyl synthetase family protein, partial [Planctomycetota bacterium]
MSSHESTQSGSELFPLVDLGPIESDAPSVQLPPRIAQPKYRKAQSNIPDDRRLRDRMKELAKEYIEANGIVPPLTFDQLLQHASGLCESAGLEPLYRDYLAVILNNEAWRDELAHVPFEKRLLLVPKCLRVEEHCPAPFDEFGMLCKECGLCSIEDLSVEAERLGYAVLIAEGSAIVRSMIETRKIEAIVGVSCLNVLEKCFPHMEAAAIPGMSIPLLQDDCINTTVDLDWVWDVIHLTSADKTYRMDLDALKSEVQSWFEPQAMNELMGAPRGETEAIARDWLARDGKRWRPYLSVCVYTALAAEGREDQPPLTDDIKKLAIAVECFHKASLIHDDIEDNDRERYGQETLHETFGVPIALNVGDFLLGEGYRLIGDLDLPAERVVHMLKEAARGHNLLCRGQGAELYWTRKPEVLTSMDVLGIFKHKTAPAFEIALQLGALFADADEDVLSVLSNYSEALGIAYQIRDDLDDFTGESDSHDLKDLRPSLILAIAHKRAEEGAEQDLIASLWRRERSYESVQAEVHRILEERGVE